MNKITSVILQFGEMVHIVPDIFRFAFEEVSRNSAVERAELKIEVIPIKSMCLNCLNEVEIHKEAEFKCQNCSSIHIEIIQGKEILILSCTTNSGIEKWIRWISDQIHSNSNRTI